MEQFQRKWEPVSRPELRCDNELEGFRHARFRQKPASQIEIPVTALLYPTPDNPLPPVHMDGTFKTHDGLDLRYAVFKGKTSPAKGTVVLDSALG